MKQSKKIFTRMVLNNWGGMNHEVIYFHEFVNLFSGKSGSGKSTAMDAMQVVLYGSIASDFLNKAADDTKNKRSVLSYLRGEQKDGSANREDQDFYAQIVLELEDTGTQTHSCIGVTFEVGHADQDLRKYYFFSHAGKFPEDDYLGADGLPYSSACTVPCRFRGKSRTHEHQSYLSDERSIYQHRQRSDFRFSECEPFQDHGKKRNRSSYGKRYGTVH